MNGARAFCVPRAVFSGGAVLPRILLLSDVHLCHVPWYGHRPEARLEKMLADIRREHEKSPIERILMLGDYSLDYWESEPGSYAAHGVSNTQRFIEEFAARLPCPFDMIPGNHEQYPAAVWERLTGFPRQFSVALGEYLFVMLDTYANPPETGFARYTGPDMAFLTAEIAAHAGKKIFLCAHSFTPDGEPEDAPQPEAFLRLVRENHDIAALFAGHSHLSAPIPISGRQIYQTGGYSYTCADPPWESMWGFRELILRPEGAETAYIVPANTVLFDGEWVSIPYHRQDAAHIRL